MDMYGDDYPGKPVSDTFNRYHRLWTHHLLAFLSRSHRRICCKGSWRKQSHVAALIPRSPNESCRSMSQRFIPRQTYVAPPLMVSRLTYAHLHAIFKGISHALLHLAAAPEYMQPLREEAEGAITTDGWTKAAMDKMWKIDSFLKESQRVNGVSLSKWAVKMGVSSRSQTDRKSQPP